MPSTTTTKAMATDNTPHTLRTVLSSVFKKPTPPTHDTQVGGAGSNRLARIGCLSAGLSFSGD
jgi:hypothetical protein